MPKNTLKFGSLVLLLIVCLLSGALGGGGTVYYLATNNLINSGNANKNTVEERHVTYIEESSVIEARKKVVPSVVSIIGMQEVANNQGDAFFFDPFGGIRIITPNGSSSGEAKKQPVSAGTGFIIDAKGVVLTNKHVVGSKNTEYKVVLNDGTEYPAEVVSRDPLTDVAVLQMKSKEKEQTLNNLPFAQFGDSDNLQIGQKVIAIGNALAEYQNTTTEGIISATGREIIASDKTGSRQETLTGLLQTDAAINLGNSGGPLVSLDGKVIGMNTAIDAQANGIGFAIPINDIKPSLESLRKYGKIVRPIIGVRYVMLTEQKAKELELDVKQGAYLIGDPANNEYAVIPGGPGDKAGLENKDVILEVDGEKITIDNSLQKYIRAKNPGDKVTLKIWRNGKEITKEIELGKVSEGEELK